MDHDEAPDSTKEKPGNLIYVVIDFLSQFKYAAIILLFAGIVFILFPLISFMRAKEKLILCRENMRKIGTALEMYSTDHSGHYPTDLKDLSPEYLKTVPTCPSAGIDTYTDGYCGLFEPDEYSFYCRGKNHSAAFVLADYPKCCNYQWSIIKTSGHPIKELDKITEKMLNVKIIYYDDEDGERPIL